MTSQEIKLYFHYHNENIRLLKIGFDQIRNQIKSIYHKTDRSGGYLMMLQDTDQKKIELRLTEKSLYRILSGIQVSWAEECIKRLWYEKNVFSDAQRTYLIELGALDQKWYTTLKLVFAIAYDLVPVGDELCETLNVNNERRNLGDELVDQYFELRNIITNHLVPNFSIRNKVQHGEWLFAFKPKYSAVFSQDITDRLDRENVITTTSRMTLVNAFYQMIVDMARFKSNAFALNSMLTPFEYYYEKYMRKIKFEVEKISNPDLNGFIQEIIEREIRGKQYKINRTVQQN